MNRYDPRVFELDRRTFLKGLGAATTLVALPGALTARVAAAAASGGTHVLDAHAYAVVTEATARLIPGPRDDPAEIGHPGAREAMAARYIDTLLGAFETDPPMLFAGGPFSNRSGNPTDDMARFLGLTPAQLWAWRRRIAGWKEQYSKGVAALDQLANGDFATASDEAKDAALAKDPEGFTTLLFTHTVEAMYAPPEYGGNHGLAGWRDIGFPGDVEPRGYTDAEVSSSSGSDVVVLSPLASQVLSLVTTA